MFENTSLRCIGRFIIHILTYGLRKYGFSKQSDIDALDKFSEVCWEKNTKGFPRYTPNEN